MRNFLRSFSEWRTRFEREPLAILLDYDGTLAPIAPVPQQAKLPVAAQQVLKNLVKLDHVRVGVISGRSLSDLKRMISVRGVALVGSHGLESPSLKAVSAAVLDKGGNSRSFLFAALKKELHGLPGIFLEEKPFSLAIHYRQASLSDEKKAKKIVLDVCSEALAKKRISMMAGKKVVEIMSPLIKGKGFAVEKLLRGWGKKYLPIFIGDDVTDESAFAAVRRRGLTVKVGSPDKRSAAQYYVNDVEDVRMILEMILYSRGYPSPGE